jgi:nicotinamidase-related amidase
LNLAREYWCPGIEQRRKAMEIKAQDTALVVTDSQNDFLSPKGITWKLVGKSVRQNNTVDHIEQLFKAAKANGYDVCISPHYCFPSD